MRKYLLLGIASLLLISCSKEQSATQSIDTAAVEYMKALTDGTLDGYLKYDQPYQNQLLLTKASVPSDMWASREAAMRETTKDQVRQNMGQTSYGGSSGACYLIVRAGAAARTKEVRSASPGSWQVFYEVSYADEHSSPIIPLASGRFRFFKSGAFSVQFQQVAADQSSHVATKIVAQPNCVLVDGTPSTRTD